MVIRKMTIDDYHAVYLLWMSCAGMGLNNLDDSKEGIEKFIQRNPDTCLVAEKDSAIIGVIMVGNDGRRGYIYHTAVHPDYRKQGIAKRLVDDAMNELLELGINKVLGMGLFEKYLPAFFVYIALGIIVVDVVVIIILGNMLCRKE